MRNNREGTLSHPLWHIILYAILFLFFFQLISDFIEAIYVFGLLGTSIPVEIVSVLFLFSPALLLFFKRSPSRRVLVAAGELFLACRIIEVLLDTRGAMIVSGLGVAAFLVYWPGMLSQPEDDGPNSRVQKWTSALLFGLSGAIFTRAINSSVDISTHGWTQAIGWILAIIAAILIWKLVKPRTIDAQGQSTTQPSPGPGRIILLSIGIMSVFLILYFAFTSPNVIARWTGFRFKWILLVEAVALIAAGWFWFRNSRRKYSLPTSVILIWNILFVLALVLTIVPHQVDFPTTPDGYPLLEPTVPGYARPALFIMLLSFPIVLIDFALLLGAILEAKPSAKQLGIGFTISALFTLIMILAHVFTTVYDYIPVIGPFFRDKFWLVYLVVGIGLALPILVIRGVRFDIDPHLEDGNIKPIMLGALIVLCWIAILGEYNSSVKRTSPPRNPTSLSVLTYNIQQGYSEEGRWNFDGQLALIQDLDPDIIGLQESDTNRIAGGNTDVVDFFADHLDMYSYYGPKTVPGTFGIALLSKFPIENAHTYYLYSQGEQVAAIKAQIRMNGEVYNIFVTHLGNGGPIVQQKGMLDVVGDLNNVVLMGDFNFRPPEDQYTLTIASLEDAYLIAERVEEDPGFDIDDRIDHVFLSPGMTVDLAKYITDPQSDHPAMYIEITLD